MEGTLELVITALGNDVGGVSAGGGRKTVFVRGALPGERVRCRVTEEARNFMKAELLDILEPSPWRVEPFCRYFGLCGGCSLQSLDYSRQLFWKREWISKALRRTGVDLPEDSPLQVIPSPDTRGCRNRVSFDMTPEGPGLHRYGGDPFPVDGCPLQNRRGRNVFDSLAGKPLAGCGRVSVRGSDRTGEAMVEFFGMPDSGIPPLGPGVTAAWKDGGEWPGTRRGKGFHEELGGITYPVSPGGFFQVNTSCAEVLVKKVAGLLGCGEVLDLYGGCGTFALPAAAGGARVTSVELNPVSSADGERAAACNGISGVRFISGRVRHFLLDTVRKGKEWDAVVVDPPRAGLGVRVSRLLRRVGARKMLYVSCNPFSLARDLSVICGGGWKVAGLHPVDMFPQTDHVETAVELIRKVEE